MFISTFHRLKSVAVAKTGRCGEPGQKGQDKKGCIDNLCNLDSIGPGCHSPLSLYSIPIVLALKTRGFRNDIGLTTRSFQRMWLETQGIEFKVTMSFRVFQCLSK